MAKTITITGTFLRNWDTGLFYREPNDWVANDFQATDFKDVEHAIERGRLLAGRPLIEFLVMKAGRPLYGGKVRCE